jgi:hypothetical protein
VRCRAFPIGNHCNLGSIIYLTFTNDVSRIVDRCYTSNLFEKVDALLRNKGTLNLELLFSPYWISWISFVQSKLVYLVIKEIQETLSHGIYIHRWTDALTSLTFWCQMIMALKRSDCRNTVCKRREIML